MQVVPSATEPMSEHRIEEARPPRHKDNKTRIEKYFSNLNVTSGLGDFVVFSFSPNSDIVSTPGCTDLTLLREDSYGRS